jgi:PAS domain S-box-containing protein
VQRDSVIRGRYLIFAAFAILFAGLYLSSLYSYLLFHSLSELFCVVVAFGIFIVAWNSRSVMENNYLLFLGISYLYVAALDMLHALSYTGMGVFPGYGSNLPTQLWISARYLESLSLLAAPLFLRRKMPVNAVFYGLGLLAALALASIFYWKVFPDCYIEGEGLTAFKKGSEYAISLILLAALWFLRRRKEEFEGKVYLALAIAIAATIGAELAFTFYVSVYGLSNLVGHFLKIISFILVYAAIIHTGLKEPQNILFRKLRRAHDFTSAVLETAGALIMVLDSGGRIVRLNRACEEVTGHGRQEAEGKRMWETFIAREEQEAVRGQLLLLQPEGLKETFEGRWLTKDGDMRLIAWSKTAIRDSRGEVEFIIVSGADITERKLMEEWLRSSLREKEMLIKEIYHRVKNNLMVISSLLSMQSRQAADEQSKGIFRKTRDRVKSMSMIHERLSMAAESREIDFADYTRQLVKQLFHSYGLSPSKVDLLIDMPDISLDIDQAVACGLIINELVSNTFKHAFSGGGSGEVSIRLTRDADDGCTLSVKDNGAGFPGDIDIYRADSLGMQIVTSLVAQLSGTVELTRSGGTEFRVWFRAKKY